jgi:hypothetical protein
MTRDRPQKSPLAAILAGLACVALASGAAAAKGEKAVRAAQVQTVLDCRTIADATKRLACFDGAVAAMAEAETKGDLVTIDREQRREVRRQAFGLSLPALTLFDHGEKGEDADKITTTVTDASKNGAGKWVIQLEGGAVWRQIDDTDLYKTPHRGSTAIVRRAALGSFFMKVDGDSAFRVHRDN